MKRIAVLLCALLALTLLAPGAGAQTLPAAPPDPSANQPADPSLNAPADPSQNSVDDAMAGVDAQEDPSGTPGSTDIDPVFRLAGDSPRYEQGETIEAGKFEIKVELLDPGTLTGVRVTGIEMQTSIDLNAYPLRIDKQTYAVSSPPVENGCWVYREPAQLYVRADAPVSLYDIPVVVSYEGTGAAGTKSGTQTLNYSLSVGPPSGGAAVSGDTHIPKVIISGFSTNPGEVVAGEDFVLNVTFKNTSGSASVTNFKAALTSEVFNPVSGSSTLFIDSLAPGATRAVSIKLHAKADASPGSYSASFALNYDVDVQTKDNAPVTDTEVISIPVKQVPKIQVSTMQVVPTDATVGSDVNLMTSVNNTGKSTLYNVNVKITDAGGLFSPAEQYLGNLQSGASGAVDLYVTPMTAGSTTLQLNVSYEDENGNIYNATQTAEIMVTERSEDYFDPGMWEEPAMPEESGGTGWWVWVVIALVAAGITAIVLIRRRKAKQRALRDKMEAKRLEELYLRESSDEETRV